MKKLPKCDYCNKPLSIDNTVIIRIDRFDKYGFSSKQHMVCTACYDNTRIQVPYKLEVKDNPHKCGDCKYLIFQDYRHNEGTCRVTREHRCFTDSCVREGGIE